MIMKTKNIKEFLKIVEENPNLPIYAWVNNEVVLGDEWNYWLGEFWKAEVTEYVVFEMYGENRVINDEEEIIEYLYDNDERDLPEDEILKDITEKVKTLIGKRQYLSILNCQIINKRRLLLKFKEIK